MKEELLHFIWKHKLLSLNKLTTTTNEPIEIINPGIHNTDSGPDFFNAKIKIGETIWAGNVEIHVKSSDWFLHNHHNDKTYSNIILHAVYQDDNQSWSQLQSDIPLLIMPISKQLQQEYQSINRDKNELFCGSKLKSLEYSEIENYLDVILVERLEEKHQRSKIILEKSNYCWNTLYFNLLLKAFGGFTNNLAFELIAQRLPFNILLKHADNIFQLEAILFGMSGLLSDTPKDNYQQQLKTEFEFVRAKHSLNPIESTIWKFMRLRPPNFPTIRIAQLAAIIHKTNGMFAKTVQLYQINDIFALLDVETSQYWKTHYHFGKQFNKNWKVSIGKQTKYMIVCNVVIPFLLTYYRENGETKKTEDILDWMQNLPSERNSIVKMWQENGVFSRNMAQSQALYHLKSRYCEHKRCLHCRIGQKVLAKTSKEEIF